MVLSLKTRIKQIKIKRKLSSLELMNDQPFYGNIEGIII